MGGAEKTRSRFSTEPIAEPRELTNSRELMLRDYEGFIFDSVLAKHPFSHWTDHTRSFWGRFSDEPTYSAKLEEFPKLQQVIAEGLDRAGYTIFAAEIRRAPNESKLNEYLAKQYTAETSFYLEVNRLLRSSHDGTDIGQHSLASWIAQFNCALRKLPRYNQPAYRGTDFTPNQIAMYREREFFVWSPFVSASKSPDVCKGGNVLFEIRPWGALDEFEKRDGRDISLLSQYPDEEEVIFPMCCAYRPISISRTLNRTEIVLEVVDMN